MTPVGRQLRLGTRRSLLAVAQARLVRRALLDRHPELRIELVEIDTRGDRDLATPLDRVAAPDFFCAELDRALLHGRIDFTVHSLKDLGEDRPAGIIRAAVPARENPRDVIVFRGDVMERLRDRQSIRIGTSSARRKHCVAKFLTECLPSTGAEPCLDFVPLRGPVDQRVARVSAPAAKREALDGVVLALAGLARLWRDADGRRALRRHLQDVRWMVLPLSECPTAPAQGALALECRTGDEFTRRILADLDDRATAGLVQRERDALREFPEADRPGVGVTAIEHETLGALLYRGGQGSSQHISWNQPAGPTPAGSAIPWDGGAWQAPHGREPLRHELVLPPGTAVFVAHWFAASDALMRCPRARIWVSGTTSWRKLAERGIWVEGCADNLGFADITATLACEVLSLPGLDQWTVLTRRGAESGWRDGGVGRVVATYELARTNGDDLEKVRDQVRRATDFFWGSIEQYRAVEAWLPDAARHACGAGKTAHALRRAGIESPLVFPSRQEWRSWLR
ncbi:MAG: hydroxymethylbilane synthase [Gammaproteobacteria bacterium]